jgi:hypothetical protein
MRVRTSNLEGSVEGGVYREAEWVKQDQQPVMLGMLPILFPDLQLGWEWVGI